METFSTLVRLIAGTPHVQNTANGSNGAPDAAIGPSQRMFLAVTAALCAVGFSAIFGFAAGGAHAAKAFANLASVPMLLIVSALASLPAVLLLWKLLGTGAARASDLLVGYAVALFGGTLVLAVLSPIVALYQHSSQWVGPWAAFGSCVVAFIVGAALLMRVLVRLTGGKVEKRRLAWPVAAVFVLQAAAIAQLASVIPPVLDHRTHFGRGVDGFSSQVHSEETDSTQTQSMENP